MSTKPTRYFVWRRDDGYVGSTAGRAPRPVASFKVLLETDYWPDARDCIERSRDKRHFDLVAAWEAENTQ